MAVERDRGEWETEGRPLPRPGLGKEDRNGYGETKKEGRRDKEKEGEMRIRKRRRKLSTKSVFWNEHDDLAARPSIRASVPPSEVMVVGG